EVRKRTLELERLNRLDKELRAAHNKRRSTDRAVAVLSDAMGHRSYIESTANAFTHIHRRSNTIIQDGERPGEVFIHLPIPRADGTPRVEMVKLTTEQAPTDAERLRVDQFIQEISTWLGANPDADPAKREAYVYVLRRLNQFLNPDYAMSRNTVDEAGLW